MIVLGSCHINIRKIQKDKITEDNYNSKTVNGSFLGHRRESSILLTMERLKMASNANNSNYNVMKSDLFLQNEAEAAEKNAPSLYVTSSNFSKTDISSIKRSKYNSKTRDPIKIDDVELRKYDSVELSGI